MERQVHGMVPAGIQSKQLVIHGMRDPSQRMPKLDVLEGSERPANCVPVQFRLDVRVRRDIKVVVIVDEWIMVDRVVKGDGRNHEDKRQNPRSRLVVCEYTG